MATTTFIEPGTDATQDLTFFINAIGTVASATDQAHTGPSSLKLTRTNSTGSSSVQTPAATVADSGSQVTFWFRTDTIPSTATRKIVAVTTSTATDVWDLEWNSDGTTKNQPIGATAVNGTKVLAVNTWYRICVSYYITNSTTFQFKAYIDGTLDSTSNAGTLTTTTTDRARFYTSGINPGTINNWFDDIYIATGGASSSSQPDTGNVLCTAKRPNANGTTNGFTTQIGAGGSGYGSGHSPQVNERPLSITNGWSIVGAGSAVTEEYNIENASTGDVDISAATLIDYVGWVYTKALAAETGQIIVNNANSNISITTTASLFTKAAASTTYPAGTGTDIGEITDTSLTTVSLYECGIVFAYTPASQTVPMLPLLGVGV